MPFDKFFVSEGNLLKKGLLTSLIDKKCCKNDIICLISSVANSSESSVIVDHLGVLVSQNRCRFLKMTEHN